MGEHDARSARAKRTSGFFGSWFLFWEGALIAHFFGLWWAAAWCAVFFVFATGIKLGVLIARTAAGGAN